VSADQPFDLQTLQALLHRLIAAPNGVAEGLQAEKVQVNLEDVIRGDERLSAVEHLEIYANAYFYRLLDILKEEYPATLAVLGADHFHNLVTGYLLEYPPTEPSVLYAGRYLADFLKGHPLRERWAYIADLVRLERTVLEVFHRADAPALDAETMRAVPVADWPNLEMRAHSTVAILDSEWPVNELLRAVENKLEWHEPAHTAVSIVVWRKGFDVYYRALEPGERGALGLALEGKLEGTSFATMCEAVAAEYPGDDAPAAINRLLARWLADGLLTRIAR
jgi:putative DNA-binding protein